MHSLDSARQTSAGDYTAPSKFTLSASETYERHPLLSPFGHQRSAGHLLHLQLHSSFFSPLVFRFTNYAWYAFRTTGIGHAPGPLAGVGPGKS